MSKTILIIGAGPAGLSAAHLLCKEGQKVIVYESHSTAVGGLSQTARQGGFLFDIGGHRFYTKAKEVEEFWHDILGEDFLRRTRLSRIFYNGTFFKYPLELGDVLKNISFFKGCEFLASYIKVKILKKKAIVLKTGLSLNLASPSTKPFLRVIPKRSGGVHVMKFQKTGQLKELITLVFPKSF